MSNIYENQDTWVEAPFTCATDLSAKQHLIVKESAAGVVAIMAAATDLPVGVLKDKPNGSAASASARVVIFGLVKLIAGAAITAGARIQGDAAGKAIPLVATGYGIGRALTAASNDGDEITAFVNFATPPLQA